MIKVKRKRVRGIRSIKIYIFDLSLFNMKKSGKKKKKKDFMEWLNWLAVAAGIVAIIVLSYGIIRSL